jgi:hypothetical protein
MGKYCRMGTRCEKQLKKPTWAVCVLFVAAAEPALSHTVFRVSEDLVE